MTAWAKHNLTRKRNYHFVSYIDIGNEVVIIYRKQVYVCNISKLNIF